MKNTLDFEQLLAHQLSMGLLQWVNADYLNWVQIDIRGDGGVFAPYSLR